ncbi:MAG: hypothetical protein IPM39_25900 [Chloroflexi bacterium]|nr:hypothetical protein [Chloroflexota bacterium]
MNAVSDEMFCTMVEWSDRLEVALVGLVHRNEAIDRVALADVLVACPAEGRMLVEYEWLGGLYRQLTEVVTGRMSEPKAREALGEVLRDMDTVFLELDGRL